MKPKTAERTLPVNVAGIPGELRQLKRWVAWRHEVRDGKTTKVPIVAGSMPPYRASATDPATWTAFSPALVFAKTHADMAGVGFVLADEDPYTVVDLDDCVDPESGRVGEFEQRVISTLDSYTEVSPSGTGVHIFIKATIPGDRCRKGKFEVYSQSRFICTTGNRLTAYPETVEERQAELSEVYGWIFAPEPERKPAPQRMTQSTADDADVIAWASSSDHVSPLWQGDFNGYDSQSEADLALINHLAWRCGPGADDQVIRIFRQSGLGQRDKAGRDDYMGDTVSRAYAGRVEYWTPQENRPRTKRQDEPRSCHHTDVGNAERLVDLCGADLRWCDPFKKWLRWDGKRWRVDDARRIVEHSKQTVKRMYVEAATLDDDDRKRLIKHALSSERACSIRAMIDMAQSSVPILPDDLDRNQWLLNVANGTLDLKTGELRPHSRDDLITKLAPVAYDPDAACPKWEKFLREIFAGDDSLIGFVKRVLGYSLTGDTSEQAFFILHGSGANGKSTLLRTISAMLGDYSKTTPAATLLAKRSDTIPNDVAALKGARFVLASESDDGRRLAEGLVKQLSGGDEVSARFMKGEYFSYVPTFKIMIGTNHRPRIRGRDYAMWRRIRLIPFGVTIRPEAQDHDLADKLLAELPGILAWAVDGCVEWQRHGLREPEIVQAATAEYRSDEDEIGRFVVDCCDTGDTLRTSAKNLREAFEQWSGRKIATRTLNKLVEEAGYTLTGRSTGGLRYWLGLGLSSDSK